MKTTRKTGKAVALYCGGVHYLIEVAVREDGVVCERFQERTIRGYQWGAWRVTANRLDVAALPREIEAGFSTLFPAREGRAERLRLPV